MVTYSAVCLIFTWGRKLTPCVTSTRVLCLSSPWGPMTWRRPVIQSILRLSSNLIKHVLAHMRVHGRQGVIQKVEGPGVRL